MHQPLYSQYLETIILIKSIKAYILDPILKS